MASANMFDVKDKIVLVTGGGTGIGRWISEGFLRAGAKVYICAKDLKEIEGHAEEINRAAGVSGKCIALQADISNYESIEKLVVEFKKREKHLNVLVNNAGTSWVAPFEEFPDSGFDKVMQLNVHRVFTLTQKLYPLLKASHGSQAPLNNPATVINIGSAEGIHVPPQEIYPYTVSKAALHQLTKALANRLGPEGVTVNALACGAFDTRMYGSQPADIKQHIVDSVPLKRVGQGPDIAGMAIFLAARAGAYVNGAIISLDGGLLISAKY